jgi:alpha-beta hydrolase superfamily lysophospholipase
MTTRSEAELPLYFGAEGQLFGLYNAADDSASKAVLLCPALGQEQIRCHRLYRQLAHALAAEGIPSLRFDYYGSGDSAGASAEVDWNRCLADTAMAADELRSRSGIDQLIMFGARLGGSVVLSSAAATRAAQIITWDPVLDGAAFVARLDAMQAALRVDTQRFNRVRSEADVAAQWQGFPISDRLREQLLGLKPALPPVPTLLIDSLAGTPNAALAGEHVSVRTLQQPTPWEDMQRLEMAILSHPLIQAVTGHLRETAHA